MLLLSLFFIDLKSFGPTIHRQKYFGKLKEFKEILLQIFKLHGFTDTTVDTTKSSSAVSQCHLHHFVHYDEIHIVKISKD